jgi:hypothetical protein
MRRQNRNFDYAARRVGGATDAGWHGRCAKIASRLPGLLELSHPRKDATTFRDFQGLSEGVSLIVVVWLP